MEKVIVFPFETRNGNKYILDTNTGTVMPANDLMKEVLDLFIKHTTEEIIKKLSSRYDEKYIKNAITFVERWTRKYNGFFKNEDEKKSIEYRMNNFSANDIKEYLENGNTIQLVLNLTEDCNLRCKYCYLTETYNYTRNRTQNKMSLEVGIKALDVFFEFIQPIAKRHPFKHIAITFYGGEPLLNYSMFRNLIEYCNEHSPLQMIYNITSNGLLLSDEIMDFIVSNKVHIAISLDGTEENHDRNRVLANGQGCFDKVIGNIKRFKERYPKYERLSVICVYDLKTDIKGNVEFFEQENLPHIVFLNLVSSFNTNYYDQFTQEDYKKFYNEREFFLQQYIENKVGEKEMSQYLRVFFELGFAAVVLRQRHKDTQTHMLPYTGTCVPGIKISVRTDGTYDICERVNPSMPIGDIYNGLDFEKITQIIKKYNSQVTDNCYYCPISKSCPLCYAQCLCEGDFKLENNFCSLARKDIRESFSSVYTILELNNKAFDDLEGFYFGKSRALYTI